MLLKVEPGPRELLPPQLVSPIMERPTKSLSKISFLTSIYKSHLQNFQIQNIELLGR